MYDCVIVGAGPAGLSAALCCCRGGLKTAIFEKQYPGGQLPMARVVENYPGFNSIAGYELAKKMDAQAKAAGAEFVTSEVTALETDGAAFRLSFKDLSIQAATVILAMGGKHRRLNVPGEAKFLGRGVSHCAACDGAFFKGRGVILVAGRDAAAGDALYLSNICEKVYFMYSADVASESVDALRQTANIEILDGMSITAIAGDKQVEGVEIADKNTGARRQVPVAGVFIDTGAAPQTDFPLGGVALSPTGHIIADADCKTNIPGVFAAGDAREKSLYQIVTAAADGAVCAAQAIQYIGNMRAGRSGLC